MWPLSKLYQVQYMFIKILVKYQFTVKWKLVLDRLLKCICETVWTELFIISYQLNPLHDKLRFFFSWMEVLKYSSFSRFCNSCLAEQHTDSLSGLWVLWEDTQILYNLVSNASKKDITFLENGCMHFKILTGVCDSTRMDYVSRFGGSSVSYCRWKMYRCVYNMGMN